MAVKQKIFIPTFISSVDYQPVRTLPHIYFYNGLKDCEPYYIQHYPSGSVGAYVESTQIEQFPYFDNYDGLIPTTGSNSLLFFNETSVYGEAPTASLYNQYWDKYVSLLYNPVTRLLNASAIIPLADYFDIELNDIVQWRGNYYHLRAVNDYNLKDGTCNIQLLGPIIADATSPVTFDCNFNFSSSIESAIPTTTIPGVPTTTTGPIGYQYFINYAEDGGASNNSTACGPTMLYSVWSTKSNINNIGIGDVLYSNSGLSSVWNGNLEWYGLSTAYGLTPMFTLQITTAGVVATKQACSQTTTTLAPVETTSTTTLVPTTTIAPTTTLSPTTTLAPTTSTTTLEPTTTLAPTTTLSPTTTLAPTTSTTTVLYTTTISPLKTIMLEITGSNGLTLNSGSIWLNNGSAPSAFNPSNVTFTNAYLGVSIPTGVTLTDGNYIFSSSLNLTGINNSYNPGSQSGTFVGLMSSGSSTYTAIINDLYLDGVSTGTSGQTSPGQTVSGIGLNAANYYNTWTNLKISLTISGSL